MPTYTVSPIPNSTRWKVESNGRVVSRHNTKANARERAETLKSKYGGTVTVQGSDGRFQFQSR